MSRQASWLGTLLGVLNAGLIVGLAIGLVGSLLKISSNHFINYGLIHLALLALKHVINQTVLGLSILLVGLFGCYKVLRIRSDSAKNRFAWLAVVVVLAAIGRLVIDWYAVPIATIPVWIRRTVEELVQLLRGQSSLTHFLNYLRNRIAAGSLLIAIVMAIGVVAWLMRRIDLIGMLRRWQRLCCLRLFFPLLIAVGLINLAVWIDHSINKPQGYNVILIGIDTWRADHVSSFGYKHLTMPNVDDLASQGFRFINAYSTTSWTLPSFLSILTSLYQSSHGVISSEYKLAPSHITLAEILRNEGYVTAGFISGTYLKRTFGFDQGFDKYEEAVTSAQLIKTYDDITSPKITSLVDSWIRSNRKRTFFVFAHYWDPHFDYIPPAPFDTIFDPDYEGNIDGRNFLSSPKVNANMDPQDLNHIISLYDGELRWTDLHLGHLFDSLRHLGILDKTIIVIVGDHGEEFFEHGGKGHRNTLYNEVIHVPIILRLPKTPAPQVLKAPVSTVDIVPTLLDLLGIKPPGKFDGRSLVPLMKQPSMEMANQPDRAIYAELSDFLSCLIKGRWKIIYDSKANSWELYDIVNDFNETTNLAEAMPDTLSVLKTSLLKWLKSQEQLHPQRSRARYNPETRRQLKALGYVQ